MASLFKGRSSKLFILLLQHRIKNNSEVQSIDKNQKYEKALRNVFTQCYGHDSTTVSVNM